MFGYARVSTKDQTLDRQIDKLTEKGIPQRNIYYDEQSGRDFNRAQYQILRKIVRKGDLVYFDALDRLGRDFDGIINEWKYFTREIGCDIVVLENEALFDSRQFRQQGDFGQILEHLFLGLLGYVASQEKKKNNQRTREALAARKARGEKLGRPERFSDTPTERERSGRFIAAYESVRSGGMTAAAAARMLGISTPTWYRRVKDYETRQA